MSYAIFKCLTFCKSVTLPKHLHCRTGSVISLSINISISAPAQNAAGFSFWVPDVHICPVLFGQKPFWNVSVTWSQGSDTIVYSGTCTVPESDCRLSFLATNVLWHWDRTWSVNTANYSLRVKGVFTWHRGDFRSGASLLRLALMGWLYICLHDTITKCHAGASHPDVSSPQLYRGKNFTSLRADDN